MILARFIDYSDINVMSWELVNEVAHPIGFISGGINTRAPSILKQIYITECLVSYEIYLMTGEFVPEAMCRFSLQIPSQGQAGIEEWPPPLAPADPQIIVKSGETEHLEVMRSVPAGEAVQFSSSARLAVALAATGWSRVFFSVFYILTN